MGALIQEPGGGERLDAGPNVVIVKADSEATGGQFYLGEATVGPGFPGPPPHRHREMIDMFYVLEGTLTLLVEEDTVEAEPGTFVCVPPGVRHTFSNPGDEPVRFLNFSTPGGFEGYMRDLIAAANAGTAVTPEEIGKIASKYDFEPA